MAEVEQETTWDAVRAAAVGTIFIDRWEDGLRFVVLRGPGSCCAYIGVPKTHPLAGMSYDDLPVECHGGLTYGSAGGPTDALKEAGLHWYGWDYAHSGDTSTYPELDGFAACNSERQWLPQDVDRDSWSALYSFKKLMKIAEAANAKAVQS